MTTLRPSPTALSAFLLACVTSGCGADSKDLIYKSGDLAITSELYHYAVWNTAGVTRYRDIKLKVMVAP